MTKADFALQWLDYLGNQIFLNGERIFEYKRDTAPDYGISKLDTRIKIGQQLGDENDSEEYSKMTYEDLINKGYLIVSRSDFVWKRYQSCYYKISRKTRQVVGISQDSFYKANIVIQHDATNRRVRLLGENVLSDPGLREDSGVGRWVVYDDDAPIVAHYKKRETALTKDEVRARLRGWSTGSHSVEAEYQSIPEIPVLLTDDKNIVCIKKQITCQRMIVVGESGQGKSVFTNALGSRLLYAWEDRVAWLIDPLNQFNDISLPQNFSGFNKINEWINNPPRPVPAIQLYLACKNNIAVKHENISLILTLSFMEFLNKYKFYTHGIKEYDVGDTIRYLMDFKKEIKDATDASEIRDIMFEKVPNAHKDKGMQAMIYKWVNTFETIFKEKFTSNLYQDEPLAADELELRRNNGTSLKGHPFIICYEAGLVPILNVSAARRQRWMRNYLADLMQKIVEHQITQRQIAEMERRKPNRVWIIADELNEIYEHGKKKDNAYAAFEELYRQGRFNNIGFIGNTQSLKKLSMDMFENASHICCVYMKSKKDRKMIGETYELDKEVYNMIEELKQQEMMIFSKEPFIVYDRWGRRAESKDKKWFKGRIIPPMNMHKAPGTA